MGGNAREGGPSALPGLSVLCEHRFVVVVGERILKPRLEDRLGGLRWVAGGLHPHAGLPHSEVAQDALDDIGLVDECHDAHLGLAVVAAHAGEAVGEVPAAHELPDHLRDDRAQEAVLAFVTASWTCPASPSAMRTLASGRVILAFAVGWPRESPPAKRPGRHEPEPTGLQDPSASFWMQNKPARPAMAEAEEWIG